MTTTVARITLLFFAACTTATLAPAMPQKPPVPTTPPRTVPPPGPGKPTGKDPATRDAPATPTARPPVPSWPSFRGPFASGVADGAPTPTTFDVPSGKNVQWKRRIPGLAHSSPVLWGDRIFVTTAVKEGEATLKVGLYGSVAPVEDDSLHEFKLLCVGRSTGTVLWSRTCFAGVPKIKRHPKGSHAASTPATDGTHVAAFFGSEGLHVYDLDGKKLWSKDLGVLDSGWYVAPANQWGFGSSPVIHEGRLYVVCDVQKDSFVAAFDVKSGAEIWRTRRDEVCGWGSPTVDVSTKRHQLVVNGFKHMGGYDLATGKELWKVKGGGDIPVPTPVVAEGLVFLTNAHGRMAPILAVSTAAIGEIPIDADQSEHMVWSVRRGGNYMQTPIVYRGNYYGCRDNGVLSCIDAKTGKQHYRERLTTVGTGFTASGIAADGKLYFPSEDGEVHVVAAGNTFKLLAVNKLGETCMASPAAAGGTLYFRTRNHLVAVRAKD